MPERFGKWNSNYRRFRRWTQDGVWKQVFGANSLTWIGRAAGAVMIDSPTVRAHQHAAGQKKVALSSKP